MAAPATSELRLFLQISVVIKAPFFSLMLSGIARCHAFRGLLTIIFSIAANCLDFATKPRVLHLKVEKATQQRRTLNPR